MPSLPLLSIWPFLAVTANHFAWSDGEVVQGALHTEASLGFQLSLDGLKDDAYGPWTVLEHNYGTGYDAPSGEDLSAAWAIAHDPDFIHVIIRVIDDTLTFYGDKPDLAIHPYHNDMVEFVFDADFSRGGGVSGSYDGIDDWRIEVLPQHDGTLLAWSKVSWSPDGGDPFGTIPVPVPGWQGVTRLPEDGNGWTVEFRFPKATYGISSADGTLIGMDMSINDDDDGGFIDHHLTWNTIAAAGTNRNPADWGIVELRGNKVVRVPEVEAGAIALDGVAEVGYSEVQVLDRTSNASLDVPRPDDLSAAFKVAHDQAYLYLHVEVTDDILYYFNPETGADPFRDDSIELVLDWDNSKGGGVAGSVDTVDDWRHEIAAQADGSLIAWPRAPWNPTGLDTNPRLEEAWEGLSVRTASGYVVELRFPFSQFGFLPVDGAAFGFDLAVNDDDINGDQATHYITWNNGIGINRNPANWGTLILESSFGLSGPLEGARAGATDWYHSAWFGWYWSFGETIPWVYSLAWSGWVYAASQGDALYIWPDTEACWYLTGASLYPWAWSFAEGAWLNLFPPPEPEPWESVLYPMTNEGYRRATVDGFQLPDFTRVGYQGGDADPPVLPVTHQVGPVEGDATAHLQQAIDAAAGGVLLIEPGTYALSDQLVVPEHTVLRGSGPDLTFLVMEKRSDTEGLSIIVGYRSTTTSPGMKRWSSRDGPFTDIVGDLPEGSKAVEVESASFLEVGDTVLVGNLVTDALRQEYNGTTDYWPVNEGFRYLRQITAIEGNTVTLDQPVLHLLQARDQTFLTRIDYMGEEIGIEDLSLGFLTPDDGLPWLYGNGTAGSGSGASYHNARAISFSNVLNGWIRNVRTFSPEDDGVHIHSRGIDIAYCRRITVDNCFIGQPAHRGGAGNGYLVAIGTSSDILVRDSSTYGGRHDFLLGSFCAGIVFTNCSVEEPFLATDTHGSFNHHVLYDNFTVTGGYQAGGDALQSINRGTASGNVGFTGGDVVFWNVRIRESEKVVHSAQATVNGARGYVIGVTRVPPGEDTTNSGEWREGIGAEAFLRPQSLYQSMLHVLHGDR